MENKITTPVSAGVIIGLSLIILSLIVYFAGLYTETWNQYVGFAILVGGIIWAVINHGRERDYTASFGNLFSFGFKVTTVIISLMILYTILSGFLFPDIKAKVIEIAREQALRQPGINKDQIEQGMAMFAKNYTLFIILTILFWDLVLGVVSSLIGAALTRKRPASPFENI